MKMNLILHPGHPKCGSSSIQKFLYDNRATLEAKGYALPDRFFHFGFEKNSDFSIALPPVQFFARIYGQGDYAALENRIVNVIASARTSDVHTIILSAENVSGFPTGPIHALFSKYFNVQRVLYYIRKQDDFMLSAWQQWGHKTGRGIVEFCDEQVAGGFPDYLENAEMLKSHYGNDILDVAPFSRKVFHNGDLIFDFLVRTGLDSIIQPQGVEIIENKSLNPLTCEYLAKFPDIYRNKHDNLPKINMEKYKHTEPWLFESRKDYLTQMQRKTILDRFDAGNRKLHAEYFPSISYDLLFGFSDTGQRGDEDHLPSPLEKQQIVFLQNWVQKWLRFNKFRTFYTLNMDLLHKMKSYFSRSR